MDTKQEIAELKAKLAELEAKVNTPLDCYTDTGFYVRTDGDVNVNKVSATSSCDYNIIRNKETAETVAPLVQIQRALINFKCEHDPVFDYENQDTFTCLDICDNQSVYNITNRFILDGVPFSTIDLAESALDMLKRRGLIK